MDRGERVRAFTPGQTVVARNVANSDGSVTRAVPAIAIEDCVHTNSMPILLLSDDRI
jgi:hypothetical protein